MSDTTTNFDEIQPLLYGRLPIYTGLERFDPNNTAEILSEVNEALSIHSQNLMAMEYLYWYRRGLTPISARKKEIRPEICSKVNVAMAEEVCAFKSGYFMTQPAFYCARKDADGVSEKVDTLNEFLYRSGKQLADNKVVDWFHTVGKGNLFVKSNDDPEVPFLTYALDPRSAFVAKSLAPGNRPVYGIYSVKQKDNIVISLWDDTNVYTLEGTKVGQYASPYPEYAITASAILDVQPNPLGRVPIIEYYYNSMEMAAFEAAIPLINAINLLQSDRLDATEQAVQSLLVFYNCELGEDDKGDAITPAMVRKSGALFLKSIGENKADLKEIVTNLEQSQSQVFIDNLREQVLSVCAMPFSGGDRGYSNASTGTAQFARDGWYQADTAARNTEDLFLESNAYFDEIILSILREKNLLDLKATDIALQFVRNETANVQSKAQAFNTLLASGMHPELAAAKSGISNDPVSDMKMSEKYLRLIWGDPDKKDQVEEQTNGEGEAEIVERSVAENENEGAI